MNFRTSDRAIILDENDRVLLCRFGVPLTRLCLSKLTEHRPEDPEGE